MRRVTFAIAGVLLAGSLALGCSDSSRISRGVTATAGDAEDGRRATSQYGCGSCHEIPSVKNANGDVGPPLIRFGNRSFIAGRLANTEENLVRWILDPKSVDPETAMPQVGVTRDDAVNMAAFLESLR